MNQKCAVVIFLCSLPAVPAPPGKSTVAASDPLDSMAFLLKYLPTTPAEDEGTGNAMMGDQVQGRVQVLNPKSYTERNCQLFSKAGSLSSGSKYTSMTANGQGKACTYSTGKQYEGGAELHKVFAYNKEQCCNACVATSGCTGATFLTSSKDHSGGEGPQTWEGFGIHTVDVTDAKTTGGLTVDKIESNFAARLGDHTSYDQFMDYSITFFTYTLQPYITALTHDKVPFLLAQWESDTKETWYSMIFLVSKSEHVIELVSQQKPASDDGVNAALPQLEQRMSSAHCAKFTKYSSDDAHLLYISSINRATSNVTMIDNVYTQIMKATSTFKVDEKDVVKRCYSFDSSAGRRLQSGGGGLDEDLCFTKRTPDSAKDKIFSVLAFEQAMWSEHAAILANDPTSLNDKYTDNHYALPIPQAGITALSSHFNLDPAYPITKDTRLAFACKQSYIIDPTGWSIQPVGPGASWPGCGESIMV